MISMRNHFWIMAFSFLCCNCHADPLLDKNEIGRDYPLVREDLIKSGDSPVSQGNLSYNCDVVEDVCSLYPEEMDCAINVVGQPVLCAFEWKSKTGQRYSITTAGEDPQKFPVIAIERTPKSLFDKGIVK